MTNTSFVSRAFEMRGRTTKVAFSCGVYPIAKPILLFSVHIEGAFLGQLANLVKVHG